MIHNFSNTKGTSLVSINRLPMQDPVACLDGDIILKIFEMLKVQLPTLALVNKQWRDYADNQVLYKRLYPKTAFGIEKWKEYVGDPDLEPRLPRRIYYDIETYGAKVKVNSFFEANTYSLVLVPEKIKVSINESRLEMTLDSLEVIGKLMENSLKGHKVMFMDPDFEVVDQTAHEDFISKKRTLKKTHWVWIDHYAKGGSLEWSKQLELIEKVRLERAGARLPQLVDLVTASWIQLMAGNGVPFFADYLDPSSMNIKLWEPEENSFSTVCCSEQGNKERSIFVSTQDLDQGLGGDYDEFVVPSWSFY